MKISEFSLQDRKSTTAEKDDVCAMQQEQRNDPIDWQEPPEDDSPENNDNVKPKENLNCESPEHIKSIAKPPLIRGGLLVRERPDQPDRPAPDPMRSGFSFQFP